MDTLTFLIILFIVAIILQWLLDAMYENELRSEKFTTDGDINVSVNSANDPYAMYGMPPYTPYTSPYLDGYLTPYPWYNSTRLNSMYNRSYPYIYNYYRYGGRFYPYIY